MAEWPYGTIDWLDPAGMSRPCRRLWRATPALHTPFLHDLLQWRAHSPILEQGRADTAGRSDCRKHSTDPSPRRITPSVCSDLISDKDSLAEYTAVDRGSSLTLRSKLLRCSREKFVLRNVAVALDCRRDVGGQERPLRVAIGRPDW